MAAHIDTDKITPNPNKLDESQQFVRDLLRYLGLGVFATLNFGLVLLAVYFFKREWVGEEWPWILAGLTYVVCLIIVIHAPILGAYYHKTTIPKKTIQASEYAYLLSALIGILSIGGFGRDIERVNLLDRQDSMQFNIDRVSNRLKRVSDECENKIPERLTQSDIAHACGWIENARDYLETNSLSLRAWKRLDAERQELMSKPAVQHYRLPSDEMRDFVTELKYIGTYMGFYFELKEEVEARAPNRFDPVGASEELWFKVITICALGYSLALRLGKLTAETLGVVEK